MSDVQTVSTVKQWESLVEASKERPVFLFKHSLTCSISSAAWDEFRRFADSLGEDDPPLCSLVEIQKTREVSNHVASTTGVSHESPQVILLHTGEVRWHASHWSITTQSLAQAVADHLCA